MVSKISAGIKVSVDVYYQPDYSNPINAEYMFAYRITIENNNAFSVKLLNRHWFIFDSNGDHREVEGDGVVGLQPIINPGQQFQCLRAGWPQRVHKHRRAGAGRDAECHHRRPRP